MVWLVSRSFRYRCLVDQQAQAAQTICKSDRAFHCAKVWDLWKLLIRNTARSRHDARPGDPRCSPAGQRLGGRAKIGNRDLRNSSSPGRNFTFGGVHLPLDKMAEAALLLIA